MYEGRLREFCVILAHYEKVIIKANGRDNAAGLLNKINKKIRLVESIKVNNKRREFYCKIRNTLVHHKSYLNSKSQVDLALIYEIRQSKYLALTSCSVGKFDNQLRIKKSNFLTDYLTLMEEDLKLICRNAMKL